MAVYSSAYDVDFTTGVFARSVTSRLGEPLAFPWLPHGNRLLFAGAYE